MTEQHERARLSERLAVLEERMETMNERYDKGWALLREDMAKRDAEAARRETRLLLAVAGLVSLAVVILGILIRLPA